MNQAESTLIDLADSILPALAFILDMNRRTGGFYGVNEALFSSALACIVFSTIGAQPLTIVGITGLISLFNYTIFDIIKRYDVALYPQFMTWVAIWAAIFHWLFAVWNFCDYMRYVTDFSSQSFGAYVGIIYCSMIHFAFRQERNKLSYVDSQGRGATHRRVRKRWPYRRLHERDHCINVLLHRIRPRDGAQRRVVPAMDPWFSGRLRLSRESTPNCAQVGSTNIDLTDRYNFLDWVCSLSRPAESDQSVHVATHSSLLPDRRSWLARRLLESGGQVGLCCFADWIPANASFLL